MRILLINDTHKLFGGAEDYFFRLKKELQKHKNLEVFSFGFSHQYKEGKDYITLKESKSKVIRQFWRIFFNLNVYLKIKKVLSKVKPDIIHIHNVNKYTPSLIKAIKNYPLIQTMQDFRFIYSDLYADGEKLIYKKYKKKGLSTVLAKLIDLSNNVISVKNGRLLKNNVNYFIASSPLLKTKLLENGFKNVQMIPNFLEFKETKVKKTKNSKNILFVGCIEENKGIVFLLYSLKDIIKNFPNLKLKIIGEGELKKDMIKLTQQLNIQKNVEFLGWKEKKEVIKEYLKSFLIVVPSICTDNAPVVIQEAMCLKKAVIGSNRGGIPWLIKDGYNGLIFNPQKKGDFKEKISYLLTHPKTVEKMGLNGYIRIKKIIDIKKRVKENISIYEKIWKK